MQEATEEKPARFPDLRQMLDDLGVQNGDNATTAAVNAAVDWLDLEGQQGTSDAVERDRQDIAIEHIHETAGDGTYGSEDDGDHEENKRDCGSPEELQRSLDCIDEFATLTDNPLVSHHVREIREHVRKIREEVARTFHGGKEAENGETAERRMREVDAQRHQQEEADRERANAAFNASEDGRRQGGVVEAQQRRQRVQMQEEAVNTAIIQETEEELQKINKSLYKVNEIYRDLASIVEQQQDDVEHIESNTEAAHARAQEGLAQVQKANEYQPSCTIS